MLILISNNDVTSALLYGALAGLRLTFMAQDLLWPFYGARLQSCAVFIEDSVFSSSFKSPDLNETNSMVSRPVPLTNPKPPSYK